MERAHCHRELERQVEGSSVEETKEQGSLDCCCWCCCSCCMVQWHVRLLFAMGSWPAFANGVPNTICGRPRLDVRLVVRPAQFGSISIRRRCSQLAAQVPQQHSADEQMQCLIKHSDWFAARDLRRRTATGFICKRLNQNETEQSQWSRSACTPNCTRTAPGLRLMCVNFRRKASEEY